MLHAFNRGKSSIYRRYLGWREIEGEKQIRAEDELTALLLGPLDFLRPEDTAHFWHYLLIHAKAPYYSPETLPNEAKMHFWPKESGIEPDLVVELGWPDGHKIDLLVELKWRSKLSGQDQLHRQWQDYFLPQQRQTGYHLFIAPDTSEAVVARNHERGDVWQKRLLEVSWLRLMGLFSSLPAPLQPWANQVKQILEKLNIRSFQGFEGEHIKPLSLPSFNNQHLFWRGFIGFQSLPLYASNITQPVFFTDKEQTS